MNFICSKSCVQVSFVFLEYKFINRGEDACMFMSIRISGADIIELLQQHQPANSCIYDRSNGVVVAFAMWCRKMLEIMCRPGNASAIKVSKVKIKETRWLHADPTGSFVLFTMGYLCDETRPTAKTFSRSGPMCSIYLPFHREFTQRSGNYNEN